MELINQFALDVKPRFALVHFFGCKVVGEVILSGFLIAGAATLCRAIGASNSHDDSPAALTLEQAANILTKEKNDNISEDLKCGVYCLYSLLKLDKKDITLNELEKVAPGDDHGVSLEALEQASKMVGAPYKSGKFSRASLHYLPLPAIIHLEPSDAVGLSHYVILLEVEKKKVRIFDPALNLQFEMPVASFLKNASGYGLFKIEPFFSTGAVISFMLLGGVMAYFFSYFSNKWFIYRRRGDNAAGHKIGSPLVILIAAIAFSHGCEQKASQTKVGPAGTLFIDKTKVDLGFLSRRAQAVGKFNIKNISSEAITLEVGAASCTCTKAEINPGSIVKPGDQVCLNIHLNTEGIKKPGHLNSFVSVGIKGRPESFMFTVDGMLEGLGYRDYAYMIRKKHLDAKVLPSIELVLITERLDSPFEINSVTFRGRSTKLWPNEKDKGEATRLPGLRVDDFEVNSADYRGLKIEREPFDGAYRCFFSLPVALLKYPRSGLGEIEISYSLCGKPGICNVDFGVVID